MARPREEDSEQENPRNLKPILILAESNNNYLRCLTLLNTTLFFSLYLYKQMNKYIPQLHTDHDVRGLLAWSINNPLET